MNKYISTIFFTEIQENIFVENQNLHQNQQKLKISSTNMLPVIRTHI